MANSDKFLPRTDLPGDRDRYQVDGDRAIVATTPSVQQAAAGGNATTIRVNEEAGFIVLPGLDGEGDPAIIQRNLTADVVLVNAQVAWLALNQDRIVTRVAYRRFDTGAIDYMTVAGVAAAHGAAAAATAAAITALVGAHNPWISLYAVTVWRSADAVVTLTYNNIERPLDVPRADGFLRTSSL